MMTGQDTINELDVVALTTSRPDLGLRRGQVGTVVHVHGEGAFEVEFVDTSGHTYALTTLRFQELLPLRYDPVAA